MRGVSRSSRTLGAGCDGRLGASRRVASKRTAKPCGPDAPTLASSSWEASSFLGATVANKPGRRGEPGVSRKTIARGMPGVSGVTVVTIAGAAFFLPARPRAHRAPGFPCALIFEGAEDSSKTRAKTRGEIAQAWLRASTRCLTSESERTCRMGVQHPCLSSPAKAGDPVFQRLPC